MSGFCDVRCPKCGKKICWRGTCVDRPKCPNPKCQHRPPQAELEKADAEMDRFIAQMEEEGKL